ncbi:hypothetical protein [Sporosarcina sp. P17b]|uniref:hypothetical protein n=2 Tax=unclassified Sporosarcina TaxID=2647733 RepID=UPI000C16BED7|nr:hypothetical protein [Sporosarcina sp. P17b]PIC72716.1 hypothetical protein CSV76_13540 [Sporosarcina sp. P17b]
MDRGSTLACSLKVVKVMLWTRAGTWGIAYSHEPAGGGAFASCLMATAYPAVVPTLLSTYQFRLWFIVVKTSDWVVLVPILAKPVPELPYTLSNAGGYQW